MNKGNSKILDTVCTDFEGKREKEWGI